MTRARRVFAVAAVLLAAACVSDQGHPRAVDPSAGAPRSERPSTQGPGRGFPADGPWVSYYGDADTLDVDRVARTFRIINIDADPDGPGFTAAQIARLRAGGRNRVISYLNVGAVERERRYWPEVPDAAKLGRYDGYPDEIWMDPGDPAWRRLVVGPVAARLAASGVDGFYLDNLEVIEGGEDHPRCDDRCRQGGLDLVGELRDRYPRMLIVLQNAAGPITSDGRTSDGRRFADLLDGVTREETFTRFSRDDDEDDTDAVYEVGTDPDGLAQLRVWRQRGLQPGSRPFFVGTEDYVNDCANTTDAATVRRLARAEGFSPYVSNKSALQDAVCY